MIKKIKLVLPLTAILLLSFWAIRPLFCRGFFPIHDDTQVVRVQQMAQALKDGQFPVRWVGDLGYGFGYPIFNFYAPLAYYVGGFFNLIGFDALVATKAMFGVGIILSGIFMYLLAREFWGELGGMLAALFYIYAPYHALDIYVRGAVGEFWAMAFLPLVFFGLWRIFQGKRQGLIVAAIGFAAVILSHNLTALMSIFFILPLGLFLFFLSKQKKLFTFYFLLFTFLAFGLSAFYWLPALVEMNLTKVFGQIGGGADFHDHFVYLDQLWASPWGFGGSAPGRLDGMSFMIGKLHLLVVFLALLFMVFLWKRHPFKIGAILFAAGGLLLAVFLTNQISQPIWEAISPLVFIQYPWRFLIFVTLASSFMAGSVVNWQPKKFKWWSAVISGFFMAGLLVFNSKYFQPQTYFEVTAVDYINEENIKWKTSKISDEYLPKDFSVPQSKDEVAWEKVKVVKGDAEIKSQNFRSHFYQFVIEAKTDSQILINIAYFPGWHVWIDNQKVIPTIEEGRIKLALTPGMHRVVLKFANTPIRSLANLISLLSLVGIVGCSSMNKESKFRDNLVNELVKKGCIKSQEIEIAFRKVPRHLFIANTPLEETYSNGSIITKKIGIEPISSSTAPSLMASMLELLRLQKGMRVLEIGTGTGYNAALLAELVGDEQKVFSVDIDAETIKEAQQNLAGVGYNDITIECADGAKGLPEHSPYDRIIVTASVRNIPKPLVEQLKEKGIIVLPIWVNGTQITPALEKQKDGNLIGLSTTIGGFMGLRSKTYPERLERKILICSEHPELFEETRLELLLNHPPEEKPLPSEDILPPRASNFFIFLALHERKSVELFLEDEIDEFSFGESSAGILDLENNSACLISEDNRLFTYGTSSAYEKLLSLAEKWESLKRPGVERLQVFAYMRNRVPKLERNDILLKEKSPLLVVRILGLNS